MRDFYNGVLPGLLEAKTWVELFKTVHLMMSCVELRGVVGWWRQVKLSKAVVAVPAVHWVHIWLGRMVQLDLVFWVECYKTVHLMMRQRGPSPPVETTPGSASGQWALCANLIVTNDRRRGAWRLEVEKRMFAVLVTG